MRIRPAFTMIEMVFVIVILGILAAVAIPRLAATRDDAVLVKGKSQVSAIRSGIALQRSLRLMRGEANQNPATLDGAAANTENTALFFFNDGNQANILESPIMSRNADGGWIKPNDANLLRYRFRLTNASNVDFDYNATTGSFTCPDSADCRALTQ